MMELLKGKPVSDRIKEKIMKTIDPERGIIPKLVILRVGDNPEDMAYERSATKKLTGMGIEVVSSAFPSEITPEDFMTGFNDINNDCTVDGILVMRPLPKHLKEAEQWMILNIDPKKDVDCIGPVGLAGVMCGDPAAFAPCTAQAVVEIIKGHGIDLTGAKVTVIGRSMVVGKPLVMLLLKENATVTVCHTKTKDLAAMCRTSDIVVSAAGHAGLVTADYVRDGQVLVDVGTNVDAEGNLTGDIDLGGIEAMGIDVKATPVPGGVGVVTTAVLAAHVCEAKFRKETS